MSTERWGTALAHYLGTPRAHHTLQSTFGHGQGGLAGVVLQLWLAKKSKDRARGADGKTEAALDAIRAELAPLDRAIAEAQAVIDTPPPPLAPAVEGQRPDRTQQREHRRRRQDAEQALWLAQEAAAPVRVEQARLCVQQATLAAVGAACDDEQALVDLCRVGLTEEAKQRMLSAAAARVRALHRDWYAAAKSSAKAWAEETTTA